MCPLTGEKTSCGGRQDPGSVSWRPFPRVNRQAHSPWSEKDALTRDPEPPEQENPWSSKGAGSGGRTGRAAPGHAAAQGCSSPHCSWPCRLPQKEITQNPKAVFPDGVAHGHGRFPSGARCRLQQVSGPGVVQVRPQSLAVLPAEGSWRSSSLASALGCSEVVTGQASWPARGNAPRDIWPRVPRGLHLLQPSPPPSTPTDATRKLLTDKAGLACWHEHFTAHLKLPMHRPSPAK